MRSVKDKLLENGIDEDVLVIEDDAYYDSLVGVVYDTCCRAVYDFDKMTEELGQKYGWTYEESVEWIEYNIIRALPYYGEKAPIVFVPFANEG